MFRQPRIKDLLDLVAGCKELRDLLRTPAVLFHTYRKSLETSFYQESLVCSHACSCHILDPMLSYCIRYYCYGAVGMAREWINQDSKVPAETFVEMTHSCMPQTLSDTFALTV